LLRQFLVLLRAERSLIHHRLVYGHGFLRGTRSTIVCWREEVSDRTLELKSVLVRIQEGGGRRARWAARAVLKSSKSILRKSWEGGLSIHGMERLMDMVMSRWSAFGG